MIIGAGITGLLLAQALKKKKIPYTVFERDSTHREQGWGLAFHWAFPTLQGLLPPDLVADLVKTYCIPASDTEEVEPGTFPFVDLKTGEVKWALPPGKRRRVVRRKLCRLLENDLNMAVSELRPKSSGAHLTTAYVPSVATGSNVSRKAKTEPLLRISAMVARRPVVTSSDAMGQILLYVDFSATPWIHNGSHKSYQ